MTVSVRDDADTEPREQFLQRELRRERERVARQLGLDERAHYRRPGERTFTRSERPDTTILFGGLTARHERLLSGALEGLGYRNDVLPCPDVDAFRLGRLYGNNGQCNPNYFTTGSLLAYLQRLEERGVPRQQIVDRYVLLTAAACGPCRFGMYEAEYRLALRNAGFDGFRVVLFDKNAGLMQSHVDAGLELDVDFFLALLNAVNLADLLNDVAYQVRPYEVVPGETDRVVDECVEDLRGRLVARYGEHGSRRSRGSRRSTGWVLGEYARAFRQQLLGEEFVAGLDAARSRLAGVRVDRTRPKPMVKVTGEFWAQTTEGDGNFRMFAFLEQEGAQVAVEPVASWITYLLWQSRQRNRDRERMETAVSEPWRVHRRVGARLRRRWTDTRPVLAEAVFRRERNRLRAALGDLPEPLADQDELARLAAPYYNPRATSGEGHLEVAENIAAFTRGVAHMVLSLKPFGCMPSTQSDGVQSAVTAHHPDMIFLPIETSGEGEINAQSRVQMALGEAKARCREEFERVLGGTGLTVEQVRGYATEHPELSSAAYHVPHQPGVAGTAAAFVAHVADRMGRAGVPSRAVRP